MVGSCWCGPVFTYRLVWSGEQPVQGKSQDGEEMCLETWVGPGWGELGTVLFYAVVTSATEREVT